MVGRCLTYGGRIALILIIEGLLLSAILLIGLVSGSTSTRVYGYSSGLSIEVSADAVPPSGAGSSHGLEVSWKVTGGTPPYEVTIEITGPDGATEVHGVEALAGTRKFDLAYPSGGAVSVKVNVKDSGGSSASGMSSVWLSSSPEADNLSNGEKDGVSWVEFSGDVEARNSTITVIESSAERLTLGVSLPGMYVYPVEMADGDTYTAVSATGSGLYEVGKPAVPVFGNWILIPNVTEAELEIDPGAPLIFDDIDMPPGQPPQLDLEDAPLPPFTKDEEVYDTDADFPGVFASLEPGKIMRGQECTILWVYPYQYNPVSRTLSVYPDLSVTVRFHGAPFPIPPRLRSESFDSMMRRMALNADAVLTAENEAEKGMEVFSYEGDSGSGPKTGWDYIIITVLKFHKAAEKLAKWRKKTGLRTVVFCTTKGMSSSNIRDILKACYNLDIAPIYVLLIGDAEYIPTFYNTFHPGNKSTGVECTCSKCISVSPNEEGYIGTDLYYTTMDGPNDYVPDMSIGRLSVDTESEAMKRVNDIIKYEQDPIRDSSFYDHAAICAKFEDEEPMSFTSAGGEWIPTCWTDNYEDRRFTQCAEDVALFLELPKFKIGKSIDRIYYAEPNVFPMYWSKDSRNFGGGPAGNVGGLIPSYLTRYYQFGWDGDGTDILNALNPFVIGSGSSIGHDNDGRFFLLYRGHGGKDRWRAPFLGSFWDSSYFPTPLKNFDRLPVVWSISCNTGWFDNETDFPQSLMDPSYKDYTSDSLVCFSEGWERCQWGGAIGIIAGTRETYSFLNDHLCWGMIDAIWPSFLKSVPGGSSILGMGDVLIYGRNYMMSKMCGDDVYRKANYEMYHWFGDPAMKIRTRTPKMILVTGFVFPPPSYKDMGDVELPPVYALNSSIFSVHVDVDWSELYGLPESSASKDAVPLEDATVTISKEAAPSDYWVGRTDEEGNVTFPDFITSTLGDYDVVVTAPNCIPFQGTFKSLPGPSGGILLDAGVYSCSSEIEIKAADSDVMGAGMKEVDLHTSEGDEESLILRETSMETGMFVGTIRTDYARVVPGDGILQVRDEEVIWAEYHDDDDDSGNDVWVQDTAVVDCQPPVFDGLKSATADSGLANLEWDAASDRHGLITYNIYRDQTPGPSIGNLIGSTWAVSYPDYDIDPDQTYYYVVRAEDAVGNEDSNTIEQVIMAASEI